MVGPRHDVTDALAARRHARGVHRGRRAVLRPQRA